jgi:tRNA nucleotidyltransferase (CCA-adding enzyme)
MERPTAPEGAPLPAAARVLCALAELPLGETLLAAAAARPDVWLVGGAVRDLLGARRPRELDVVVVGADPQELARELAARLGGEVRVHDRFGTALVEAPGGNVDVVRARRESYPEPGALPEVQPAGLDDDLARRDFTVNAIAVALDQGGGLRAVPGALADLVAGRLRVLHDASFREDPTRLLRLARYQARLGFAPDPHTEALARAAVQTGALATVSGPRVGAELRLLIAEPTAVEALAALERLGALAALDERVRLDRALAGAALALLPADARADLLVLASVLLELAPDARRALLDRLAVPARERAIVASAAHAAPALADALARAERPSHVLAAVAGQPPEAVALAGALGGRDAARRWLQELRHVGLQIDGTDLLTAGIPPGPRVGTALQAALARRLDGELAPGHEAELAAALAADRG